MTHRARWSSLLAACLMAGSSLARAQQQYTLTVDLNQPTNQAPLRPGLLSGWKQDVVPLPLPADPNQPAPLSALSIGFWRIGQQAELRYPRVAAYASKITVGAD